MGEPRVRSAHSEGDTAGNRECAPDAELPHQEVGRPTRGGFEEYLEKQHPLVGHQEEGRKKEGTALHLPGEWRPDPFERVPPRDVPMEPITVSYTHLTLPTNR